MRKYTFLIGLIVVFWNCAPCAVWATAMSDAAAALAPGSFIALSFNTTGGINDPLGSTESGNYYSEFANSASWDPIRKELFFVGHAHGATYSRECIVYVDTTNTWGPCDFPPGAPAQFSHPYGHNTVNPATGTRYYFHYGQKTIRRYTPATATWDSLSSDIPMDGGNCCRVAEYFPEMGAIIVIDPDWGIWKGVEGSGTSVTWTCLGNSGAGGGSGCTGSPLMPNLTGSTQLTAAYSLSKGVIIVCDGADCYRLDGAGAVIALPTAPASASQQVAVLTTDPVSGNFLLINGSSMYELNPLGSGSWSAVSGVTIPGDFRADDGAVETPVSNYGIIAFPVWTGSATKLYLYKHAIAVGGFSLPSLQDEKDAYTKWGWTWDPNVEPDYPTDGAYVVNDPDIHGDTEADDLWANLFAYRRTGEGGFLSRLTAWANYFKNDYRACDGTAGRTFCYDRDGFGLDHSYGYGLIALFEHNGDTAALTEAAAIGGEVDALWDEDNPAFACLWLNACMHYGPRNAARHLLLATRLAEKLGTSQWITLRDRILTIILNSVEWNPTYGMYFLGATTTDEVAGAGSYAAGLRMVSSFQIGILQEVFAHVYRTTGNTTVRDRMIAMAGFVNLYGLDPTYQYTASFYGVDTTNSQPWHRYSAVPPVTFWDTNYTTSQVNVLAWRWKLTGEKLYYDRAQYFFNRGTKGVYGSPTARAAADTVVHHFIDTLFDPGTIYLDYNKGELQYVYLLFENGGQTLDSAPPTAGSRVSGVSMRGGQLR